MKNSHEIHILSGKQSERSLIKIIPPVDGLPEDVSGRVLAGDPQEEAQLLPTYDSNLDVRKIAEVITKGGGLPIILTKPVS